jgi:hypothetical protein
MAIHPNRHVGMGITEIHRPGDNRFYRTSSRISLSGINTDGLGVYSLLSCGFGPARDCAGHQQEGCIAEGPFHNPFTAWRNCIHNNIKNANLLFLISMCNESVESVNQDRAKLTAQN